MQLLPGASPHGVLPGEGKESGALIPDVYSWSVAAVRGIGVGIFSRDPSLIQQNLLMSGVTYWSSISIRLIETSGLLDPVVMTINDRTRTNHVLHS